MYKFVGSFFFVITLLIMEGFIQLHRKMIEWEWYDDINTKVLFIHLLLKANWKDKKWRGIDIYRGEYITSFGKLSEETGLSIQQIRTSIKKLKSTQEITQKGQGSFSIIKVIKYDDYQSSNMEVNKPVTNEQQTDNKVATTTNKDNKDNKEINNISTGIIETKVSTKNLQLLIKDTFDSEFIESLNNKYKLSKEDFNEQCSLFYSHWAEKSPNGKKERWEKEKTFDPKLRFYKWLSNNKKWSKPTKYEDHENIVSVFG